MFGILQPTWNISEKGDLSTKVQENQRGGSQKPSLNSGEILLNSIEFAN